MSDFRQGTRHDAWGSLIPVYVVEYLDDKGELREAEFDFTADAQEFADDIGPVRVRPAGGDEYSDEESVALTEPPPEDAWVGDVLDAVSDVPRRLAEAQRARRS